MSHILIGSPKKRVTCVLHMIASLSGSIKTNLSSRCDISIIITFSSVYLSLVFCSVIQTSGSLFSLLAFIRFPQNDLNLLQSKRSCPQYAQHTSSECYHNSTTQFCPKTWRQQTFYLPNTKQTQDTTSK